MQALGNLWLVRRTRGARGGGGSLSVAVLLVGTAGAQWTRLAPSASPSARTDAAIAYDVNRRTTYMFGGLPSNTETHAWDGRTWHQVASSGPPAVWGSAMEYDVVAGGLILFGGKTATAPIGDTWRFNGTAWSRLAVSGPSARCFHALAPSYYGTVILFGGQSGAGAYLGDTWLWDGFRWGQLAVTGPSPRAGHRMAWDPRARRVLLFGGQDASGYLADTWAWDGSSWFLIGLNGPPAVERSSMVTVGDSVARFDATGRTSDLWVWSGVAWVRRQTYVAPSARTGEAMAAGPNGAVLFGGYSPVNGHYRDTWQLDVTASSATVPSGFEGNASFPFGGVARRRMQTVFDPMAFSAATRGGMVRSARLRRDGGGTFAPRDADLRLSIGTTPYPPARMSTDFRANYWLAPTTVFQGTIAMAASQAATPEPFDIVLPFAMPFAWGTPFGALNLVFEIEVGTGLPTAYDLDAVQTPYAGLVTGVGQACAGSTGTPSLSLPSAGQLVTGGMIEIAVTAARPGAIAFSLLGDSSTQWAGIPLPWQWPRTNCFVYHNWVVNQSSVVGDNGVARATYPVPALKHLVGSVLYSQWGIYEGTAGTPPLVTTGMARMTIGPIPSLWDTITNADGSAVGAKAPGVWQTPVIQFGVN